MISKISRRTALKKYPQFPTYNPRIEKSFYPQNVAHYYLTVHLAPINSYIKSFSVELAKMMKELKIDSLIFLGEYKRAWLYQKNDYKKVKEATQYFLENGISENFDGAIKVSTEQLTEFLKHFVWLTKSNAALPSIHFMDEQQTIVGYICQYIVLHLSSITPEVDKKIKNFTKGSSFIETDEKHQHIFPSRINGRQTSI